MAADGEKRRLRDRLPVVRRRDLKVPEFKVPDISVPEKLRGPEDEESNAGAVLYWLLRNVILGPGVDRLFRPNYEGVHNVPKIGPAILASNHLSYVDWMFIPLALHRRVTFVAKSDYFTGAGVRGWAQRRFFKGTGQVPVDRSGGRASESALQAGQKVLRRGELFGIFPEGTRSHDGRLYKGRTGVARLALEAGVPVIPTAVTGTDVIAPTGKVLAKVISPTVTFGEPLDFGRYVGLSTDRFILRSVTDEIMYAIMELSGQTYVDSYATSARAKPTEAPDEPPPPEGT
ncbi:lysophospholipid acyltransferase family protein [Microlunatus soli]|uniref:1-acyl-sn-glycerol-3-phosphate acyltransferase n=1 Tax=Microlunatus soli TaxID=630515 RepID=A0A1H1PL02_9ACTN|nr:lysophospholipid acyltransferase family protein [Microlunatus soli]SDS11813.1 1-acyl-sn-glycerol-3-phosphate acyltransferase [Microlunatus soli]